SIAASRSWIASGLLAGMSVLLSGDEIEEVEQWLFDPAADRDGLDRPASALEGAQALLPAHESPLDAAEGFPEPHVDRVDGAAARLLVGAEQVLAVAEAADGEGAAEP